MAVQPGTFFAMDEKRIINNYKKMQPPVANFLDVSFGNTWNPDIDATILTIAYFFQYVLLFSMTGSMANHLANHLANPLANPLANLYVNPQHKHLSNQLATTIFN